MARPESVLQAARVSAGDHRLAMRVRALKRFDMCLLLEIACHERE